ncbi:IS4 family transposase [Paenibacillus silviterrae]|uniref:IS4 family transposase n=1 Tax=Paenibacillus silviterrae TaxID=3242194 RepID=UPI002543472E|nr:IS4 family transposase [Paenibacillus chinjuensis]
MDNNKAIRVICQCLKVLDISGFRSTFDDHRTRKFFTGTAIELHVISQLLQLASYDVIPIQLRAHPELQKAIGLESISASQLSRKTESICTGSLESLFYHLISQIDRKTGHKTGITPSIGRLHLIDATDISLPSLLGCWARCGSKKTAVRLHVRLVVADPDTVFPNKVIASTSNVQENKVVQELTLDDDVTYVMDRGYEKCEHFEKWVSDGIRFVVRVRDRLTLYPVEGTGREVPKSPGNHQILRDVDVLSNKTTMPLRLVEFVDEHERRYRILTSRWDLTATEVALIYKNRWKIEIFFKWVKQHLNLVRIHGKAPHAVWNQLFMSLIAFALSLLVKLELQTDKSQWEILKTMRIYLFHPWEQFLQELFKPPTKVSKGRQKVEGKSGRKYEPQKGIKRWN